MSTDFGREAVIVATLGEGKHHLAELTSISTGFIKAGRLSECGLELPLFYSYFSSCTSPSVVAKIQGCLDTDSTIRLQRLR